MINEQRIYEYGGLLAAGYGLYQARKIHDTELEKSRQRHAEAIDLAKKQHENDMKTLKQTYLLELFNSLEQHFQQLNADLIASSRESERDMFDQRNQSFQTIILSSSVMFSALASMISQGNLPLDSGQVLLVAYSTTCSLSFSFLFLSIVFCIELVIRTSSFMYKRGRSHTRNLRKAINDTKGMMTELRGEGKGSQSMNRAASSMARLGDAAERVQTMRRAISRMQPNEIEEEFERHEAEIRGYLKKREMLNDSAAVTSYRDEVTGVKRPFKHFWEESCETWWNLAILLFYGGSLNMLLALVIYIYAQFVLRYQSIIAAAIGIALLGLVLVLGIGTVIVMRHVDRETDKRENLEALLAGSNPTDESGRIDYSLSANNLYDNSGSTTAGATGTTGTGGGGGWAGFSSLRRYRSTSTVNETGGEPAPLRPAARGVPGQSAAAGTESTPSMTSSTPASSNSATGQRGGSASAAGTPLVTTQLSTPLRTGRLGGDRGIYGSNSGPGSGVKSQTQTEHQVEGVPPPAPRLETHFEEHHEDNDSHSVLTESSVNSALTIPPTFGAHTEHIFQEEPSPRRRFLSAFGGAHKNRDPSASSPAPSSLLRSALSSPEGSPEPLTAGTEHPMRSFRFPRAFPTRNRQGSTGSRDSRDSRGSRDSRRGKATDGTGGTQDQTGGAGSHDPRGAASPSPVEGVHGDNHSTRSNMSAGITF
jgi:hypothetical protein